MSSLQQCQQQRSQGAKFWMYLVYLEYQKLNLMHLTVYPEVISQPTIKQASNIHGNASVVD